VVPIVNGTDHETLKDLLGKLDGILYPGGGGDYYDTGEFIFNYIRDQNDAGHYYPAMGICLGFEFISAYTSKKGMDIRSRFGLKSVSAALKFVKDPKDSWVFSGLGEERALEFEKNNFTYNHHQWSITPETFNTDEDLSNFWDVTSTSLSPNGTEFVASMESKKYPIFASQFHPEKVAQLWIDGNSSINHSWESIQLQNYFANEFVAMSRRNPNTFGDYTATQKYDISNHKLIDTGELYGNIYVFEQV
jgi:gamma-glutamyl hydrolase